ncbi:MAG: hypothetical protein NTY02_10565 [Acidobacteria bacterium]|nr:hypothetical protein [Acidobacteriota bacterium]
MTGPTATHTAHSAAWVLALAVAVVCGSTGAAAAAHVRGADAKARLLLRDGAARSATLSGLLDALESSDVVVHVETGALDRPGRLLFVTAGPDCRFLRISIKVPGRDADLIAWLGHELQHAVEIAAAPEVRDQNGVMDLYRRIGFADRSTGESKRAQDVWARVRDEVRFGARAGHDQ